jgi:NADH-ubiquinone oxidoreductase 11 kDa subunit
MKFVMEFAENLILRLMEDPKQRDEAQRQHIYRMKERCDKTKANWSLPLRPYGFWTFERFNSQLSWDPQISQAPGRRDPYDDLLLRTDQLPSLPSDKSSS